MPASTKMPSSPILAGSTGVLNVTCAAEPITHTQVITSGSYTLLHLKLSFQEQFLTPT
jgi:hypothetical protein